jgi:hypothetical protein
MVAIIPPIFVSGVLEDPGSDNFYVLAFEGNETVHLGYYFVNFACYSSLKYNRF